MAPLILLLLSWLILFASGTIMNHKFLKENAGAFAIGVMMIFTGIFHFIYTKGMVLMMPDLFPNKTLIVYATGVLEILAGLGLFYSRTRKLTGIMLIIFFIIIFPSNIVATMKHVKISTATFDGPGPDNLLFRAPLQLFFIVWTWYFCVRKTKSLPEY